MHSFEAGGATRELKITIGAARRLKDRGVDLLDVGEGGAVVKILDGTDLSGAATVFLELVPALPEDALQGDVWDAALAALGGELLDFFPRPRRLLLLGAYQNRLKARQTDLDAAAKSLDGSGAASGTPPEPVAASPTA